MTHHRQRLIRDARACGLTHRQAECLMWVTEPGSTIGATALRLGIKPATVSHHLLQARRRVGVETTLQLLAAIAYREAA